MIKIFDSTSLTYAYNILRYDCCIIIHFLISTKRKLVSRLSSWSIYLCFESSCWFWIVFQVPKLANWHLPSCIQILVFNVVFMLYDQDALTNKFLFHFQSHRLKADLPQLSTRSYHNHHLMQSSVHLKLLVNYNGIGHPPGRNQSNFAQSGQLAWQNGPVLVSMKLQQGG